MPQDDTSLPWGQHPLISAVLWALGTNQTHAALGEDANRLRSNSSATATPVLKPNVSSSSLKERISWKDEQGGDINEFHTLTMSQKENFQSNRLTPKPRSEPSPGNKSAATRSAPDDDSAVIDLHTHVNTLNNTHCNIYGEQALVLQPRRFDGPQEPQQSTPTNDYPLSSPSPNWGFYVSMTPPQQDAYAKSVSR